MKPRHAFLLSLIALMMGSHTSSPLRTVNAEIPFAVKSLSFSRSHSIIQSDLDEFYFTGSSDHYALLGRGMSFIQLEKRALTIPLLENETIAKVDVGYESNLFLTSEGRLFTSGLNQEGQIGNNTIDQYWGKDVPVNITSFFELEAEETIVDIYAGTQTPVIHHAVTSFNRLFVWGANPVPTDIEPNINHYAAFTGKNPSGLTDVEAIRKPLDISSVFNLTTGINQPIQILDIYYHLYGGFLFTTDNAVWTWGTNHNGLLGIDNDDETYSHLPTRISLSDLLDVNETIVAANFDSSFVVAQTSLNRFVAWGINTVGQIKTSVEPRYFAPQLIETTEVSFAENETIVSFYASSSGVYFITSLGRVWMRGYTRIASIANTKTFDQLVSYRADMTWIDVTIELPVFENDERVIEISGIDRKSVG
jgi:alpha-tubulin suppressor-like RCC1 family protein